MIDMQDSNESIWAIVSRGDFADQCEDPGGSGLIFSTGVTATGKPFGTVHHRSDPEGHRVIIYDFADLYERDLWFALGAVCGARAAVKPVPGIAP